MTESKRYVDIEIGADIGQIRLYTRDEDYETYDGEDILNLINGSSDENEQLKSDLDYFKAKNGSLETGMFNLERENKKLKSVNQELRNELKFDEKMYKTFKEIIDEADDLITSHLSKHYQRKWKNFCKHRGVLDD